MKIGKKQIIQLLDRRIFARVTVMQFIQTLLCCTGLLALITSIWVMLNTDLTLWQTVLGLLVSSLVPVLFFAIGILLPSIAVWQDGKAE